jgi:hypothetical protein
MNIKDQVSGSHNTPSSYSFRCPDINGIYFEALRIHFEQTTERGLFSLWANQQSLISSSEPPLPS